MAIFGCYKRIRGGHVNKTDLLMDGYLWMLEKSFCLAFYIFPPPFFLFHATLQ